MKRSFTLSTPLLVIGSALLLSACSGKVLDFRNAEIVNGKIYKAGGNEPFTGKVTNIPDDKILSAQQGFGKISRILINTVFAKDSLALVNLGIRPAAALLSESLCDVEVTDGRLDGEATCKKPNSETRTFEMVFKDGGLDGDFRYYGPNGGEKVVSTVSFKKGEPDGKQEVFSTTNQKLISAVTWKNGVLEGKEEAYDPNTGAVIGRYTYVNGKLDGEMTRYSSDGKQVIYKGIASAGLKNGPEDTYSATGKHLYHGQWVNGKQQGLFQQWDEQGKLVAQTTWDNGNQVTSTSAPSASTTTSSSTDACVEGWTNAFHKENGDEAIITVDQLGEWESWCKQGKRPS